MAATAGVKPTDQSYPASHLPSLPARSFRFRVPAKRRLAERGSFPFSFFLFLFFFGGGGEFVVLFGNPARRRTRGCRHQLHHVPWRQDRLHKELLTVREKEFFPPPPLSLSLARSARGPVGVAWAAVAAAPPPGAVCPPLPPSIREWGEGRREEAAGRGSSPAAPGSEERVTGRARNLWNSPPRDAVTLLIPPSTPVLMALKEKSNAWRRKRSACDGVFFLLVKTRT